MQAEREALEAEKVAAAAAEAEAKLCQVQWCRVWCVAAARMAEAKLQAASAEEEAQAAHKALEAMVAKVACRAEWERQAAAVAEATIAVAKATTTPAAPLRLDAPEVTDSEADMQIVLQTLDVRAVLQA